jgi:hypothetical protein
MPDNPRPRFLVPSSLRNLNIVLDAITDRPSAALLGCVWGFGRFDPDRPALREYDLPIDWADYGHRLLDFAGIKLECFDDDEADAYDRVELGQPVVVAVDSHELPYRPAWQRVHSARTIIVDRVERDTGTAEITDIWMPSYTGSIHLADLDRARASQVPHDIRREPLYAGAPLRKRWWTLALAADPPIGRTEGMRLALSRLVSDSIAADTGAAIDAFRRHAVDALSQPFTASQMARRAAALHLRAEIGLRAHLYAFLRFAAEWFDDPLFAAEIETWSQQFDGLARARDVLIKAVAFERPEYAGLVDFALTDAVGRERRLIRFFCDYLDIGSSRQTHRGSAKC